ncbi:MAG: RnfABCDGE type electron transport complex subunit A [Chitinivibrionia bacterium]|nr:RnfABCDGE type electron transport complex subunit A [Chitinivibrionia bacterium]
MTENSFAVFVQISIGAIFIQNFVLSRFLGLCPFFGVSKKLSTAVGMGLAVTFIMVISTIFTWTFNKYVLMEYEIEHLQTISFILIIATFVQVIEMAIKKYSPTLYDSLGVFLPLITTNCAILGVTLINIEGNKYTGLPFTFAEATVHSFMSGAGFLLALVLMAGIRERLELANVPKAFEGLPIAFISAGLIAIAFFGFSGMSIGG